MSTLSLKDRVSLCQFSFADGRRCRTPRAAKNPHFCFYHAQKEARASATETLGNDLAYFFSGNYLSACDLSTALGRLIPAVLRGDVKPKTARTVAYLMQTLLQAIHVSQHEYGEAFGGDGWRKAIRNSVNHNLDYRFPPAPRSGGLPAGPAQQPEPPGQPQPAPSPHTPMPPTSAEFAQRVVAGLQTGQKSSPPPRASQQPSQHPGPATANSAAPNHASPTPTTPPSPKATPPSPAVPLTPPAATSPAPPQPQAQPPASQPAGPEQGRRVNPREPDRSAPWLEWGRIIPPDSKLL